VKLTNIEVYGFGVWSDVALEDLASRVTVFYGPNEAGKTTLMQFVRGVLYGYGHHRRQRYLPPAAGGEAGGLLAITAEDEAYHIERTWEHDDVGGELSIIADDGSTYSTELLEELLAGIDEKVFNSVFAIGLRELQELATLSDGEAGRWLYDLSTGVDGVSLLEVTREVAASRERLFSADGRPSHIEQLLAEEESLHGEIGELLSCSAQWSELVEQRKQLDAEAKQLTERTRNLQWEERRLRAAMAIREPWQQRARIKFELEGLEHHPHLPPGALRRFEELTSRLAKWQSRRRRTSEQRTEMRDELIGEGPHDPLAIILPRIDSLGDQQVWVRHLEEEIDDLAAQIDGEPIAEEPEEETSEGLTVTPEAIELLRGPASELREARRERGTSDDDGSRYREQARQMGQQVEAGLKGSGHRDLATALEEAGNVASQLRRRMQIDERLDEMARQRKELEHRSDEWLERQMTPAWVLITLGSMFAIGAVLVLARFWLPSVLGTLGWWLLIPGLLGCIAAVVWKIVFERNAEAKFEATQRQLDALKQQIEHAKQERIDLDKKLPRGGGPLAVRLQNAEKRLAAFEELQPLDTKRREALQELAALQKDESSAQERLHAAQRDWKEALAATGLPEDLSPKQVRELSVRSAPQRAAAISTPKNAATLLKRRRSELASFASRARRLISEVGLEPESKVVSLRIAQLVDFADAHRGRLYQQSETWRRWEALSRKWRRARRAVSSLRRRRDALLMAAGTDDHDDFRRIAEQQQRRQTLRNEYNALCRQIAAKLDGEFTEQELQDSAGLRHADLPARAQECTNELTTCSDRLAEVERSLGRLDEQQRLLLEDRGLADTKLELASLRQRIDDAVHRWQVQATTNFFLEALRSRYEKTRQPRTLVEASGYLERMTEGRYVRVWTPLDEDILLLEDGEGKSLPVDLLSQGTREQLFLSLRLALVSQYTRRGVSLPLVLDDVLVNFDVHRAKAAARVLAEFSRSGHQVLMFTCHEHVASIFQSIHADVRQLPGTTDQPAFLGEGEPKQEHLVEADGEADDDERYEEELTDEEELELAPVEDEADDEEEYELEDEFEYEEPEDESEEELVAEEDEEEAELGEDDLDEEDLWEEEEYDEDEDLVAEDEDDEDPEGARGWEVEFEDEYDDPERDDDAAAA